MSDFTRSWLDLPQKEKERALDAIRADLKRVVASVRRRDEILNSDEPLTINRNNEVYIGDLMASTQEPLQAAVKFLEAPDSEVLTKVSKAVGCRCGKLICVLDKIGDLQEDRAELERLEDIEQTVLRRDLEIDVLTKALEWFANPKNYGSYRAAEDNYPYPKSAIDQHGLEFAQATLDASKKALAQE